MQALDAVMLMSNRDPMKQLGELLSCFIGKETKLTLYSLAADINKAVLDKGSLPLKGGA